MQVTNEGKRADDAANDPALGERVKGGPTGSACARMIVAALGGYCRPVIAVTVHALMSLISSWRWAGAISSSAFSVTGNLVGPPLCFPKKQAPDRSGKTCR